MVDEQVLDGLDGSNPLGFFAALGLLRWLARGTAPEARLSFQEGSWTAVVHRAPKVDEALCAAVAADAKGWMERPHVAFSYPKKEGTARDLKPPPEVFRKWLADLRDADDHEALAFALGYAAEGGLDASTGKVVKPTALHFTAGQQQFLDAVRDIASSLTAADVFEALHGPWTHSRPVKSLSWDATATRNYALRASNPSKEKRLGDPGADWFAFQALPLFPVTARRADAQTTCSGGSWKRGWLRWPLWNVPASLDAVSGVVLLPELMWRDLAKWKPAARRLRGVVVVFESAIGRSDQGGYGSFGPARVASGTAGTDR